MLAEVSEADQLVALCPVHLSRFGYGLVNGTIGVYDRLDRIWRVKSKHSVCAIGAFDLDGDGVPEMISGWSNGRVSGGRHHERHWWWRCVATTTTTITNSSVWLANTGQPAHWDWASAA